MPGQLWKILLRLYFGSAVQHWPITGAKINEQRWPLDDTMGPRCFVITNNLNQQQSPEQNADSDSFPTTNLTWFPWPSRLWLFFAPSFLYLGSLGTLAVALCMIDLFAKRLLSEVVTLAGGGRHQLLTATDKLSLLLGLHMSAAAGSGAEVWSKMLRAVMTLARHEWAGAFLVRDLLFWI